MDGIYQFIDAYPELAGVMLGALIGFVPSIGTLLLALMKEREEAKRRKRVPLLKRFDQAEEYYFQMGRLINELEVLISHMIAASSKGGEEYLSELTSNYVRNFVRFRITEAEFAITQTLGTKYLGDLFGHILDAFQKINQLATELMGDLSTPKFKKTFTEDQKQKFQKQVRELALEFYAGGTVLLEELDKARAN